ETKRLLLRNWKDSDLEPFAAMNAHPQVMKFFPSLLTKEETSDFLKRIRTKFHTQNFGLWATETRKEQKFIGYIGLNIPDFTTDFTPCVEIGWRLDASHWGQGYATEGAKAVLDYGFKVLKLGEILSWTYENNLRSRKVMEKIGMQYEK